MTMTLLPRADLSLHEYAPGRYALAVTRTVTWAQWREHYSASTTLDWCPWADKDDRYLSPYARLANRFDPGMGYKQNQREWIGFDGMAVADPLLELGGHEVFTGPVLKALGELRAETHAPRMVRNVTGAWDIPAVVSGQPLPAVARTKGPAPVRDIEIQVALTVKNSTAPLAKLAARVSKACTEYTLKRGALGASVVWVSGLFDSQSLARKPKAAAAARATLTLAHEGLHLGPWASAARDLPLRDFDKLVQRIKVTFDPTNVQETAACLSPSLARMHYVGTAARGWVFNAESAPDALRTINPRAYRIVLDADDMTTTDRSMCDALADC